MSGEGRFFCAKYYFNVQPIIKCTSISINIHTKHRSAMLFVTHLFVFIDKILSRTQSNLKAPDLHSKGKAHPSYALVQTAVERQSSSVIR